MADKESKDDEKREAETREAEKEKNPRAGFEPLYPHWSGLGDNY